VDGYAGFEPLTSAGDVVLAACWSHTRFHEVAQATNAPIATEALRRIAELYAIETEVRGQTPAHRLAALRNRSKPIAEAMRLWFEAQLPLLSGRSTLAEAIRYALSRWQGLTRFLHDSRIELDTNPVERAIRRVALGRKNHLFAGSDGGGHRWAVLCSLIEPCKLNDVEPTPISMTCSRAWSTGTQSTASTKCCRGRGKPEILSRAERSAETGRLPSRKRPNLARPFEGLFSFPFRVLCCTGESPVGSETNPEQG
jgi:hypothetical protein